MVIIMNKKNWIILVVVIVILIIFGILFFMKNNKNNQNKQQENTSYEANKTSTNVNNNQNSNNESIANTESNQVESQNSQESSSEQPETTTPQIIENQISTFSTKIYSQDSARQNNIAITCKTLNGTIVKNGATFSFCNTLGPSTSSKGYQEADIYDNNGNKKKGLGGGNCQISTTLYNAVLKIPSLNVTERHAHSNNVPYIQKGKDAAVAYGSYDFKFVNNTGNDIKISTECSSSQVTVSIISLKTQ